MILGPQPEVALAYLIMAFFFLSSAFISARFIVWGAVVGVQ